MPSPSSRQSDSKHDNKTSGDGKTENIIVVGAGPVGIHAACVLKGQNPSLRIIVFGEEPFAPYNRVQLSLYLSGEVTRESLNVLDTDFEAQGIHFYYGTRIDSINRQAKTVIDDKGRLYVYDKLILATGSRAFIPKIPGNELSNILAFRTLHDTDALIKRKEQGHILYIIGSGPLGIEAAIAMKTPDSRVYLQVRNSLLDPSLDKIAQEILGDGLKMAGIEIIENENVESILGLEQVTGVKLSTERIIKCDTVVFCTGVIANTALADAAGLQVNRGILVNGVMQTSDLNIYAVGECSEHNGRIYGLVAPGFEQVASMSAHMAGQELPYTGSTANIRLKFGSLSSALVGNVRDQDCEVKIYANRLKGIYRKLFVVNQVLVGYIYVGYWSELGQVQTAHAKGLRIKPENLQQFEQTGILWDTSKPVHIKDQPEEYIVCLCNNVTRGTLSEAMESGNRTIDSLCSATSVGLVCGSCRPLIAEMLDAPTSNLVMRHYKSIYRFSIASILLIVLTVIVKPIGFGESTQVIWQLEKLWFDNFWKQVSGYTLLFLSLLATGITLRKRWKRLHLGHLDDWRYAHSVIGVIALVVLMVHTGMRLGHNLNLALTMVFLMATLTGSLVGVFMARNHHWTDLKLRKHRTWWSRIHYTLLWMLPSLLAYHILMVYFF